MREPVADLAYEIDGTRVAPDAFYAVACDPRRSVAVEACAGAGKTWMLVSRILRALLDGAQPHEVLAITFTRKAAGEMRQRLQQWLDEFSKAEPQALAAQLRLRGVPAAECDALAIPLQSLQARLLEGGRPVQIRTFHGWFAALLRNAPLATLEELGLPARHTLLEDDSEAVDKVWRRFHGVVAADPQARRDYEASVATHGRFQTLKGLRSALSKRVEFALADRAGVVAGSVQPFAALFPEFAGLDRPEESVATAAARERWQARARLLGAQENKSPRTAADAVVDAFAVDDAVQRVALLRKAFFVADEDRLNSRLARYAPAQEAEAELQRLCRAAAQHDAWQHHQRLARLARLLVAEFSSLKRDEGWVDMNDVEQAAHHMLGDPVLSGWIQERLDAQVRHLLVDEFQDTNPLQWQALHAWLSGYAGAGGTAPSVFIVGDPKQSIYRFRRAEPQVFAAAQRFVGTVLGGARLSCDHTRRNAPEVLAAVNQVMAAAQAAGQYQDFRPHSTGSHDQGRLLRLPVVPRPPADRGPITVPADGWRDSLTEPRELPEEHLVTLECRQAAQWIAGRIAGGVAPADILVLARKRDRLAVLEDELRLLRVPAQQPEKTNLAEAPEVQDLVALLDVLVSPAHDLSLARALKSPVFGLPDASLVELAQLARRHRAEGTPRSWLALLCGGEGLAPELAAAGQALARWRQLVRRLPPHDALDAICQQADVLARYAASVPPALRDAALANLRALPGAALQLDGGRYATPYAFVRAFRAQGVRGPALAQADAVRLLTVHGAKGLEAPIVLLLDTDAGPPRPETMGVLVDWPGELPAPRRFSLLASETRPPSCHTTALAEELAAREREELNALYVAMTRAQRELVISSVEPRGAAATPSWWQRLQPLCEPVATVEPSAPPALAAAQALIALSVVPDAPMAPTDAARAPSTERTPASRFGELVHRLLELQANGMPDGIALLRLGRSFGVATGELHAARAMAQRIVGGEGAWLWDPAVVDWQADEVELTQQGEVLRLDRLVRRSDGTWWVIDYKSAAHPERDPALQAQLRRYVAVVAGLHPGATVRAAFLTGEGRLVPVEG